MAPSSITEKILICSDEQQAYRFVLRLSVGPDGKETIVSYDTFPKPSDPSKKDSYSANVPLDPKYFRDPSDEEIFAYENKLVAGGFSRVCRKELTDARGLGIGRFAYYVGNDTRFGTELKHQLKACSQTAWAQHPSSKIVLLPRENVKYEPSCEEDCKTRQLDFSLEALNFFLEGDLIDQVCVDRKDAGNRDTSIANVAGLYVTNNDSAIENLIAASAKNPDNAAPYSEDLRDALAHARLSTQDGLQRSGHRLQTNLTHEGQKSAKEEGRIMNTLMLFGFYLINRLTTQAGIKAQRALNKENMAEMREVVKKSGVDQMNLAGDNVDWTTIVVNDVEVMRRELGTWDATNQRWSGMFAEPYVDAQGALIEIIDIIYTDDRKTNNYTSLGASRSGKSHSSRVGLPQAYLIAQMTDEQRDAFFEQISTRMTPEQADIYERGMRTAADRIVSRSRALGYTGDFFFTFDAEAYKAASAVWSGKSDKMLEEKVLGPIRQIAMSAREILGLLETKAAPEIAKAENVTIQPEATEAAARLGLAVLFPERMVPPVDAGRQILTAAAQVAVKEAKAAKEAANNGGMVGSALGGLARLKGIRLRRAPTPTNSTAATEQKIEVTKKHVHTALKELLGNGATFDPEAGRELFEAGKRGRHVNLFRDEAQREAGGNKFTGEASLANKLKPFVEESRNVSNGTATTVAEFRDTVGTDPAAQNRLRTVFHETPTPTAVLTYLMSGTDFEKQYGVTSIEPDAMKAIYVLGQHVEVKESSYSSASQYMARILTAARNAGVHDVTLDFVFDHYDREVAPTLGGRTIFVKGRGQVEITREVLALLFEREGTEIQKRNARDRAELRGMQQEMGGKMSRVTPGWAEAMFDAEELQALGSIDAIAMSADDVLREMDSRIVPAMAARENVAIDPQVVKDAVAHGFALADAEHVTPFEAAQRLVEEAIGAAKEHQQVAAMTGRPVKVGVKYLQHIAGQHYAAAGVSPPEGMDAFSNPAERPAAAAATSGRATFPPNSSAEQEGMARAILVQREIVDQLNAELRPSLRTNGIEVSLQTMDAAAQAAMELAIREAQRGRVVGPYNIAHALLSNAAALAHASGETAVKIDHLVSVLSPAEAEAPAVDSGLEVVTDAAREAITDRAAARDPKKPGSGGALPPPPPPAEASDLDEDRTVDVTTDVLLAERLAAIEKALKSGDLTADDIAQRFESESRLANPQDALPAAEWFLQRWTALPVSEKLNFIKREGTCEGEVMLPKSFIEDMRTHLDAYLASERGALASVSLGPVDMPRDATPQRGAVFGGAAALDARAVTAEIRAHATVGSIALQLRKDPAFAKLRLLERKMLAFLLHADFFSVETTMEKTAEEYVAEDLSTRGSAEHNPRELPQSFIRDKVLELAAEAQSATHIQPVQPREATTLEPRDVELAFKAILGRHAERLKETVDVNMVMAQLRNDIRDPQLRSTLAPLSDYELRSIAEIVVRDWQVGEATRQKIDALKASVFDLEAPPQPGQVPIAFIASSIGAKASALVERTLKTVALQTFVGEAWFRDLPEKVQTEILKKWSLASWRNTSERIRTRHPISDDGKFPELLVEHMKELALQAESGTALPDVEPRPLTYRESTTVTKGKGSGGNQGGSTPAAPSGGTPPAAPQTPNGSHTQSRTETAQMLAAEMTLKAEALLRVKNEPGSREALVAIVKQLIAEGSELIDRNASEGHQAEQVKEVASEWVALSGWERNELAMRELASGRNQSTFVPKIFEERMIERQRNGFEMGGKTKAWPGSKAEKKHVGGIESLIPEHPLVEGAKVMRGGK